MSTKYTTKPTYMDISIINGGNLMVESVIKGNIGVLDDDTSILSTLEKLLEFLGYKAHCFQNPTQFLNFCEKKKILHKIFDLIILDMRLPGKKNGIDILNHIKKIDPKIKAVASTGYFSEPVINKYKEYGFVDILPKPYTINDLETVVERAIHKK